MVEIARIAEKKRRKVVGLMSGTSADGVDAALVGIEGSGLSTQLGLLEFETYPFPREVKEDIFRLFDPKTATVDKVSRMNFLLGELFADAAQGVIEKAGLSLEEVDLVGSHGQTICHLPVPEERYGYWIRSSFQIGEPCVIAERTEITTVADFRVRDLAAGGEGAPLVPLVDYLLFRSADRNRGMVNIGGIANLTVIPAGCDVEEVFAFDLGPGNMVIDYIARRVTSGNQEYDRDGEMAGVGQANEMLLIELLNHPFFKRKPPKSTGREEFGEGFSERVLTQARKLDLSFKDLLATVTALTARAIFDGFERFVLTEHRIDEIIVSGGGAYNRTLMRYLKELFEPIPLHPLEDLGMPSEAKEAVAFAVLANETIAGNPGNITNATGASRRAVLGKIIPGGRGIIR